MNGHFCVDYSLLMIVAQTDVYLRGKPLYLHSKIEIFLLWWFQSLFEPSSKLSIFWLAFRIESKLLWFFTCPELFNCWPLSLPFIQWLAHVILRRIELILTINPMELVSLLVVGQLIHVEVRVFEVILASSLVKGILILARFTKSAHKQGWRDPQLSCGWVLKIEACEFSICRAPCIIVD